MSEVKFKNCPFCDNPDIELVSSIFDDTIAEFVEERNLNTKRAFCPQCGAYGPSCFYDTEIEGYVLMDGIKEFEEYNFAVTSWNGEQKKIHKNVVGVGEESAQTPEFVRLGRNKNVMNDCEGGGAPPAGPSAPTGPTVAPGVGNAVPPQPDGTPGSMDKWDGFTKRLDRSLKISDKRKKNVPDANGFIKLAPPK